MKSSIKTTLPFPPLVESSLNGYYPASAVLTGACLARGRDAPRQLDLNRSFIRYLFDQDHIADMQAGLRSWLGSGQAAELLALGAAPLIPEFDVMCKNAFEKYVTQRKAF
jgi:hypothetical protein